jgi:hypothetical protein
VSGETQVVLRGYRLISAYILYDYIRDKEREIRGRLPIMLMALVALALVLSMVATLAPGAIAQDSGAAPDGAAKWGRYKLPTGEQWEIVTSVNPPPMVIPKDCCITVEYGGHPNGIVDLSAAQNHCIERPRWFCRVTIQ